MSIERQSVARYSLGALLAFIARAAASIAGIVVFVWPAVETIILGYVSWMQPTTAAVVLVIDLARLLPKSDAAGRQGAEARSVSSAVPTVSHASAGQQGKIKNGNSK